MSQRIFVNVVGFSDVERHALNTVFRLSEGRETAYSPWTRDAPEPAGMLLIDALDPEARTELNRPGNADVKLIWIGDDAPSRVWRAFSRPISWPEVVRSMDELFAPVGELDFDLDSVSALDLDLDLDFDPDSALPDTQPPPLEELAKRALIVGGSAEERLYLRARLALASITQADEAPTACQALEMAQAKPYALVLLDFTLPDRDGWQLLGEMRQLKPRIKRFILFKAEPSIGERVRVRFGKIDGLFTKPPHPARLAALLRKV